MNAVLQNLHGREFDVVVIGGGVYGCWSAFEAARRGWRTLIVEEHDWGYGTSSASSKLLHGGLRYLEQFQFGLVKTSLRERKALFKRARHLVHPLRFGVPIYRNGRFGSIRLKAGLWLYDRLAGSDQPVAPHSRIRSLDEGWAYLKNDGLRRMYAYGDCGTDDARLCLEAVLSARDAGATAASGVKLYSIAQLSDGYSLRLGDDNGEPTSEVRSSAVILATGPRSLDALGIGPLRPVRRTRGVHLVMPSLKSDNAVLLTSPFDGRVFFLIPWYGRTLLGTTDIDDRENASDVAITPNEVSYLLQSANSFLHETKWSESDILGWFAGRRVLQGIPGGHPSSVTREWLVDEPLPGLLLPIGGKLTSARADAESMIVRLEQSAWKNQKPDGSAAPVRTTGCPENWEDWIVETRARAASLDLTEDIADSLAHRHGIRISAVFEHIRADRKLAERLDPDLPFIGAEVVHAIVEEGARTLEDIVRRRIPVAILSANAEKTIEKCAQLAESSLGWTPEERDFFVDRIKERTTQWSYRLPWTSEPPGSKPPA